MSFAWPWALLALLAVPLVLGVALVVPAAASARCRPRDLGCARARRRCPDAARGGGASRPPCSCSASPCSASVPPGRRRRSPSRRSSTTILLALDVSGSMCSTDVAPNRLTAAEKAAASFITAQPGGPGSAWSPSPASPACWSRRPTTPTSCWPPCKNLTTARGTAIGQAILTSIDAIADIDPSVAPTGVTWTGHRRAGVRGRRRSWSSPTARTPRASTRRPPPHAGRRAPPARLHDRVRHHDAGAAGLRQLAARRRVRRRFRRWRRLRWRRRPAVVGAAAGRSPLVIDADALQQVADDHRRRVYRAQNADQLQERAGRPAPATITVTHEQVDLAAWFAGLGGLLVAARGRAVAVVEPGPPRPGPTMTEGAQAQPARLRYSVIASLDGYVADRDGRFDWAEPDEEVHAFVNDLERGVGTYLYGRRLYEVMRVW